MAANKFVIEIDLGNDAMRLPQHVQEALANVAKKIPHVAMSKGVTSKILDANGNQVGTWGYR